MPVLEVTDEPSMCALLVLRISLTPTEAPTAAARPPPPATATPTPPAAARIVDVSWDSTVTPPLVVEIFAAPEICASEVLRMLLIDTAPPSANVPAPAPPIVRLLIAPE